MIGRDGIPATIHEVKTAPMDVPPPPTPSSPPANATENVVPLEKLLEVLIRTGVSKRFAGAVIAIAVVVLGMIAPAVEQFSSRFLVGIFGDDSHRFDAIDAKLDAAAVERAADRRAMADLARYVEQIEADQAAASGRVPRRMPASLRAIIAQDELVE